MFFYIDNNVAPFLEILIYSCSIFSQFLLANHINEFKKLEARFEN